MALLTTSQLTFYDMKDAYHVEINPDYIVVKCDENGNSKEATNIEIKYGIYCGSTRVPGTATVDFKIDGEQVQYDGANCTAKEDGKITFTEITKDTNFTGIDSIHITFKEHNAESNGDDFTFEKYIKFVKVTDGVNGSDGTGLVFKVYSEDGTVFREDMSEIKLETVLFVGESATSANRYEWEYWDDTIEMPAWTAIEGATTSTLTVLKTNAWAQKTIRCAIQYGDSNTYYYDYISLTNDTTIYTSSIQFFNNSNMFDSNNEILIAYTAFYKDNVWIDGIKATKFFIGSVDTLPEDEKFDVGTKMYFIDAEAESIVLQEYDGSSWAIIDDDYTYTYTWTLTDESNETKTLGESKILVISKNDINKNATLSCSISNNGSVVSRSTINIHDLNDPIIGETEPSNPISGQLWLNTASNKLMIYNGEVWKQSSTQNGRSVYTQQPIKYTKGDLWVLADGEYCGKFGPGSMLKATSTFTSSELIVEHWVDAMENITTLQKNIGQFMSFHSDDGLVISQKVENGDGTVSEPFYVKITSEEMGFYDNSNGGQQVVSIGNQSATIKNLTAKDSATFDCDTNFKNSINICNPYSTSRTGFTFKIESNGSLSLVAQETVKGTWEDVFTSEENGTYSTRYSIGDTIPLDLGSEGVVDMQIAAFDTDILAGNEGGTAKITWISKQILPTKHIMNPALVTNEDGTYQDGTGSIGSFVNTEVFSYLVKLIRKIPTTVLSNMKMTKKYTQYYETDGVLNEMNSSTLIWIPSAKEIGSSMASMESNGVVYSGLFTDNESRIKYYSNTGVAGQWWLRSASPRNKGLYMSVPDYGSANYHAQSTSELGVVIGFCT